MARKQKNQEFATDFREKKPALHLLYVKWACKHLTVIDDCIQRLSDLSNLNLTDMIAAMQEQRDKLVAENAAYVDAQEILDSIAGLDGKRDKDDKDEESLID